MDSALPLRKLKNSLHNLATSGHVNSTTKQTQLSTIKQLGKKLLKPSTAKHQISGIGTGGTITGVGRALKEVNKDVEIIGVEPEEAPFISKGQKGKHRIQGISAGFEPSIIDRDVIDGFELVTSDDAIETAKNLAAKEGILAGISSGAAVTAALRVAKRLGKGKSVVVLLPDTGERYLSTGIFGEA